MKLKYEVELEIDGPTTDSERRGLADRISDAVWDHARAGSMPFDWSTTVVKQVGVDFIPTPETKTKLIECGCGAEVECSEFTNTCECGADYNMNGQRLAPREQWGEETGEHWTECL